MMRYAVVLAVAVGGVAMLVAASVAQTPQQPRVAPGPGEPNWDVVLRDRYGLSMFGDLLNPVRSKPEAVPGLFRKAGPGPVTFAPVIALGLPTPTRGGWYRPRNDARAPAKHELWSYEFKNVTSDLQTGRNLPPPLAKGAATTFDPGDQPFGVWVANDGLKEVGVFSEPRLVAAFNPRLARQPYKAMIYPFKDRATGKIVPHSFLIGWEYSTNDDFQDVVCRIDHVELIAEPQAAGSSK